MPRDSRRLRSSRSLLFTSGKGGVGTSNLVLNIAIALAEIGQRVVVLDADIGLANLDLLCGLDASLRSGGRAGGALRALGRPRHRPGRDSNRARVHTPSEPATKISRKDRLGWSRN